MYKLTIETDSLDELYNTISQLKGKAVATLDPAVEVKKEGAKRGPKPKLVEQADAPAVVEKVKDLTEAAEDNLVDAPKPPKKAADGPTYDDVKKVTLDLVKKKDKATVLGVLSKFGAKNAVELKKEQYAEYIYEVSQVA